MELPSWSEVVRSYGGISRAIKALRSSSPDPVELINKIFTDAEPVYRYLGLRLLELGEGVARTVFPMREEITRWGGIIHGGVVMAVLDTTIGMSIMTVNDGLDQYTVELKVNFLEPLREGPFTATGRVVRIGRSIAVGEGEVHDSKGRLCAKGMGTWFLVRS